MTTAVDTIIFDLGNVLMFHDNALLMRRIAERAGLAPETVSAELSRDLFAQADRGAIDGEALHAKVCTRLGVEIEAEEFSALWCSHFQINEPMLHWVEALVGRVRLLLLSNTNELHARHIRAELPLLKRFDDLLLSFELGFAKPDPEIFEIALTRAKTGPEATAFFDDIPAFVEAAAAQGIHARVFRSADEFPAQLASLGLALQSADAPQERER